MPWPRLLGRPASLAVADFVQVKLPLGQIELQEKPKLQLKWSRLTVLGSKA